MQLGLLGLHLRPVDEYLGLRMNEAIALAEELREVVERLLTAREPLFARAKP